MFRDPGCGVAALDPEDLAVEDVLQAALEHKRHLWRPVLTTKAVEDVGSGSKINAAITWEKEDVVCEGGMVHPASDQSGTVNAMQYAAYELQFNFHHGGYAGGRWASTVLVEGAKPPDVPAFDVQLRDKFVKGRYFDANANVFDPMWKALGGLRVV